MVEILPENIYDRKWLLHEYWRALTCNIRNMLSVTIDRENNEDYDSRGLEKHGQSMNVDLFSSALEAKMYLTKPLLNDWLLRHRLSL